MTGYPAEVYSFGIEIFMMTMVASVFIPLSAVTFVPVFFNMKLTSIYEVRSNLSSIVYNRNIRDKE